MDNNYESTPTSSVSPSNVLVFGILSLVLPVPIVGLIFAIVARKKAKTFVEETGTTCGQVKTGSILATIGMILNIISLLGAVAYVAYILLIIGLMGMSVSQYMLPILFLF